MRIAVIRHGEVDLCQSRRSTSSVFDEECSQYDEAPIKDIGYKAPSGEFEKIYVSSLSRSRATAEKLFSGAGLTQTDLIDEVPLRSGFDTAKKMPLWFWKILGRLQWAFNSKRQPEGIRKTKERARKFVMMICEEDTDCAVVSHGFFMHVLLSEMKKAGFKTERQHVRFKNGECITAERQIS